MFSFTIHSLFAFLCSFVPALFNFILIAYILLILPRNRVTNIFALLTLTCAFWQIDDTLLRITNTAVAADFWDTVLAFSWIFIGPFCLHFSMLYTGIIKRRYSRLYVPLLYVPPFFFLTFYQMGIYEHKYDYLPFWGWINFHNENIIDIVQIYWESVLVITALVFLCIHTIRIKNDRLLKSQSLYITAGLAAPILSGVIAQVIFPTVFNLPPIPITSIFMTALSIATVVALKKYKLFSVSDLISNETLIDSMPLIVFSASTEKRVTYMNYFALQVLEVQKEKIFSVDIDKLFSHETQDDERNFHEALERTINYQKVENIESSIIMQKGKINIILSLNPIINNNKVEGVLFTARDITELKKTHELVKHKEALLEEAQRLSHIGSWEWDVAHNRVIWSDELYRIFGYKPGEIPVTYETFLQNVHPDDRDFVNGIIQKAYNDHKPFTFYHRVRRKNLAEVIIYAQGEVTVDKNNNAIRMTGTGQDVTELKIKEEMLKAQNEELQKINAELDKFVYSASHDLRAPLTSMLGVVEISNSLAGDERIKEHLYLLKSNISRLDQFILDIMDYARNSRQEIKREVMDIEEILNETKQNLKYMGGSERTLDFRIKIAGAKTISSDKSRISIILNNLISNAIRYGNPQTNAPFVEIEINTTAKKLSIIVRDNGIGIEKQYHDKIFEMFYRVSQNSIGSGLGLYLAKESVKKLKGSIGVRSEKGKGSEFFVSIPNN